MISKEELLTVADNTGLTPNIIERDFVIGWLLAAINQNSNIAQLWAFKGGTCLKKCYFENYRFSADLDFTILDESQISETFLSEQFNSIASWLYDISGIEIPIDRMRFDIYSNPRERQSCQGRVYYGSYFSEGLHSLPRIKLDLSADELLVLPLSRQAVIHPYTDAPKDGFFIECYDYAEIFGEKVRALGERGRPRDLYDVINMFHHSHLPSSTMIQNILSQKCAYKGIGTPTLADLENHRDSMLRNWKPMLANQLPNLPKFEVYWDSLPEFFFWLEGRAIHH